MAGLGILVATLLVGARLGFAWAGGPGYEAPQAAVVKSLDGEAMVLAPGTERALHVGDPLRRGETVWTAEKTYVELAFENGSRLALDKDTHASLETVSDAEIAVRMTQGRLVAEDASKKRFTIRTNETESSALAGTFTVIDEADRAVVHVIPLSKMLVSIIVHRENGFVASKPLEIHEIAPYEVKDGSFRLFDAAKAFYTRFGVTR